MKSRASGNIKLLVDLERFVRLWGMTTKSPKETKEITVADLFSDLSESELKEAQEALDAYSGLALQVFMRLERERRERFDGPSTAS